MRYLSWLAGLLLFIVALGFAVKNAETMTLHFYLGYQWEAPVVLVLLVVFGLGAVAGVAASLGFGFKQRREILKLRRELRTRVPAAMEAQGPLTDSVAER